MPCSCSCKKGPVERSYLSWISVKKKKKYKWNWSVIHIPQKKNRSNAGPTVRIRLICCDWRPMDVQNVILNWFFFLRFSTLVFRPFFSSQKSNILDVVCFMSSDFIHSDHTSYSFVLILMHFLSFLIVVCPSTSIERWSIWYIDNNQICWPVQLYIVRT